MTSTEIAIVSALIPFIIALTAWLRAEAANRTAKSAQTTSIAAIRSAQKTKTP